MLDQRVAAIRQAAAVRLLITCSNSSATSKGALQRNRNESDLPLNQSSVREIISRRANFF